MSGPPPLPAPTQTQTQTVLSPWAALHCMQHHTHTFCCQTSALHSHPPVCVYIYTLCVISAIIHKGSLCDNNHFMLCLGMAMTCHVCSSLLNFPCPSHRNTCHLVTSITYTWNFPSHSLPSIHPSIHHILQGSAQCSASLTVIYCMSNSPRDADLLQPFCCHNCLQALQPWLPDTNRAGLLMAKIIILLYYSTNKQIKITLVQ